MLELALLYATTALPWLIIVTAAVGAFILLVRIVIRFSASAARPIRA